jgi:hypothetical protein
MSSFFSDCVVNDQDTGKSLYPFNSSVKPFINIDVPINNNNNIELSYSIISLKPDKLNDFLNEEDPDLSNVRTVVFTNQINCSLIAEQSSPEYDFITKWKIDDISNEYKKVVYPGVNPAKNISNNRELFYQQTVGVEESIHCWCLNNLYPSGYASTNVSIDMNKYKVFVGKGDKGPQNARHFNTCYSLIKDLKIRTNKPKLKVIPQFEDIDCSNLQWTSFNKFSDAAVMETVEQIINPPIESKDLYDPYFLDDNINTNYFESTNLDCLTSSCGCGETGQYIECLGESGYTGCVHNENAEIYFPYVNTVANNFVNLQSVVYVDAYYENQTIYKTNPVLLKLIFNTQFYYDYAKLPQPIINNECVNELRWNPSVRVYMPQQANYFLMDESKNEIKDD